MVCISTYLKKCGCTQKKRMVVWEAVMIVVDDSGNIGESIFFPSDCLFLEKNTDFPKKRAYDFTFIPFSDLYFPLLSYFFHFYTDFSHFSKQDLEKEKVPDCITQSSTLLWEGVGGGQSTFNLLFFLQKRPAIPLS